MTTNSIKEDEEKRLYVLINEYKRGAISQELAIYNLKDLISSSLDKYANEKLEEAVGEIEKNKLPITPSEMMGVSNDKQKEERETHNYALKLAISIINNLKTK